VENLLDIFAKEMRVAMTLTGVTSIDQIDPSTLVQPAK
jgi:L-lactate dehydrogenase (cytochrome)